MNTKLYLLPGAAGYLGSNISRQLIEKGEAVRALVLAGDPAAKHVPQEVEVITSCENQNEIYYESEGATLFHLIFSFPQYPNRESPSLQ